MQPQVSNGAGETGIGKSSFEDWIWNLAGVLAKNYHSDNGVFISIFFVLIANRRNNPRHVQELEQSIKMGKQKGPSKPSAIGLGR